MSRSCYVVPLFALCLAACSSNPAPTPGFDAGCSGCDLTGCSIDGGCGAGEVCNAGQCAVGCVIPDAGYVPTGSSPTGSPCEACNPAVSLTSYDTSFTGLAADGGCGVAMVCDNGACVLGCYLDGGFFADGGLNEIGGCLSCDPGLTVSEWSSVADNATCANSGFCETGTCESGCLVGDTFYLPDGGEQGNACAICDPTGFGGTAAFSPVSGIVTCDAGGGDYCSAGTAGSCVQACVVGSPAQEYDPSELDPQNECQSCQPTTSSTSFSSEPDGTNCDAGGDYCKGGACGVYCDIGSTLSADGGLNASNPNQCCNVALAAQAWTAGFGTMITTPSTTSTPAAFAIGDVTGDGIPDLVIGEANPDQIEIMQGKGDGTFTLLSPALSSPTGASPLVLADFNNDGHLDIAVANNGGNSVTVLLNQTDGGFAQANGSPYATTGTNPTALIVADVRQAGTHDLVVIDQAGGTTPEISVLTNQLAPRNLFILGANSVAGADPTSLVAGNFTNKGNVDIAVADGTTSQVTVFENNGTGTSFTPQAPVTVHATDALSSIATADFNQDGKPDLAVSDTTSSQVFALLNTGSGFAVQAGVTASSSPISLVCGDFNGNGSGDIATAEGQSTGLNVIINQTSAAATSTSFFAAQAYSVGAKPVGLASADVNGDGVLDLVTVNGSAKDLSVLLGQCP